MSEGSRLYLFADIYVIGIGYAFLLDDNNLDSMQCVLIFDEK